MLMLYIKQNKTYITQNLDYDPYYNYENLPYLILLLTCYRSPLTLIPHVLPSLILITHLYLISVWLGEDR